MAQRLLLFQRTQVCFPVPMWGGSLQPVTPASEVPKPLSGFFGHLCAMNIPTHTYTYKKKKIGINKKKFKSCALSHTSILPSFSPPTPSPPKKKPTHTEEKKEAEPMDFYQSDSLVCYQLFNTCSEEKIWLFWKQTSGEPISLVAFLPVCGDSQWTVPLQWGPRQAGSQQSREGGMGLVLLE